MESEEVMTASVTSNSSDNESWTIIEEDREDPLAQARIDVIQAVAEFTIKRDQDPKEDSGESDIERIVDEEAETNLESLTSDGIPVGDELSSNGDQYLWSSDHETELTSSTASTITKLDSLCPSGYPPEELMDGFSEIEKLRIYLHTPNKTLSLYLTGTLIIVFSLVCGLGVGHFLGWSERLELQEQYADVREERMDELTDSLVSCMTSPPDNQDLDDQVIRQLRDENEKLKSDLQLLRNNHDLDTSAAEEMNAILRDRINHLLTANADLERTVAKLRYSAPNTEIIEETPLKTKESMNRMAHENEQLKIAIGKERYGPRQVPVEAKVQLNILKTENDELKTEVRKFRYGVHDLTEEVLEDQNGTELIQDEHDQPNFVTLGKVQPVLPPVILLGGQLKEVEIAEEEDEGFVEDFDDEEDLVLDEVLEDFNDTNECEEDDEDELELLQPVQEVVEELAKTAHELLPDKSQLEHAAQAAQDLGHSIKKTWTEDKYDIKEKLSETLNKVYNKAHETFDSGVWMNQRADIVQDKFQKISDKWSKVQNKMEKKVKSKWNNLQKDFKTTWKTMEDQLGKVQDKYWNKPKDSNNDKKKSSRKSQDYSAWSKKNSSSMVFARAKNRDKLRKEQTRSDWLFDRANDRKRHQKLLTDAEWYNRRSFSKYCDEDGCKTIDKDVPHYASSSKKKQRKFSVKDYKLGETGPLRYAQESKYSKKS